eukprot:16430387-Heterocapsa_arctica.AAC.1
MSELRSSNWRMLRPKSGEPSTRPRPVNMTSQERAYHQARFAVEALAIVESYMRHFSTQP